MMHGELNSYADLSAPTMMATAADERRAEQADAIVARLTARYGDDALKLYLRLEDDDIRYDFDDDARDLADEQLWQRMSDGERLVAEAHQGPEARPVDATVTAARVTRERSTWDRLSRWMVRQPEWVEEVAA